MEQSYKIFTWYSGLSGDLIFYIAINSIWLTEIKNFSYSQVNLLTTISCFFSIILQMPMLKIVNRIGNANSLRLGSFLLLISNILLTFGKSFLSFVIALIIYEISFMFKNVGDIIIKNDLDFQDKGDEYIKIRSKGSFIYAVSTAIIAISIGFIFNLFTYAPMILGILNCFICFLLSFLIFDINDINFKKDENNVENKIMDLLQWLILYI